MDVSTSKDEIDTPTTQVSRKNSEVSETEEETDQIRSSSKYLRPPKLNLPAKSEPPKTVTEENPAKRSDADFPKEDYDNYRSKLPKTYSKTHCKNAIRLDADATIHHLKHLIWNYFHRLSKKQGYDHLNLVSIIPVDCGGGTYAIYVADEVIGEQLRLHLDLKETRLELRTSKVGSVKSNKSYRQSDPT